MWPAKNDMDVRRKIFVPQWIIRIKAHQMNGSQSLRINIAVKTQSPDRLTDAKLEIQSCLTFRGGPRPLRVCSRSAILVGMFNSYGQARPFEIRLQLERG